MRRSLQLVWAVLGSVALIFGVIGVVTGADGVLGIASAEANLDSEVRFFAAWYAGAGALMLWTSRDVAVETVLIRGTCGVWFFAACGRVFSMLSVGAPDKIFVGLMVVEFLIPVVVVPWQKAVSEAARGPD